MFPLSCFGLVELWCCYSVLDHDDEATLFSRAFDVLQEFKD